MAMRDDSPVPAAKGGERPAARPGRGAPASRRPATRIGDAERDTAASELGDHYAAGRLTLDELHERIGLVLSARTHGQLGRVMRDLPSARREPRPLAAPAAGEPLLTDGGRRAGGAAGHDGRLAAIGLLLLAMLIWLFTVVMFARHGYYYHHPYYPDQQPPWRHP